MILSAQDLPEGNKVVLEYAKSVMGKRVGHGVCFEFVDSALCRVDGGWKERRAYKHWSFGRKVSLRRAKQGDIIRLANHVAIIYYIDVKKEKISTIEQNVGAKNLSESRVKVTNWDFDYTKQKDLVIFRPH